MSHLDPGEPRVQDIINAARGPIKCHIPQRLPLARQKPPAYKTKAAGNSKLVVVSAQQPRFVSRPNSRPRSGEQPRPKSANRTKDDMASTKPAFPVNRSSRPEKERLLPAPRRPSTIPRRIPHENMVHSKTPRPITVLVPKQPTKTVYTNRTMTCLPDQETINRHEDLELQQSEILEGAPIYADLNEKESITSRSEKVTQLKISWQEKIVQFEKMKNELNEKQKAIMEVYAALGVTHQKMSALGQRSNLPPAEELRIMNVANLTPDQLLQLCANSKHFDGKHPHEDASSKTPVAIDMNKLYNMPSKLVGTCEQTLVMRKAIIETLEAMTTKKDVSLSQLLKKINEFNAENEMLACSLEKVKNEFFDELNDIVAFIRKCVNDTVAAQMRSEQLTYEISELNAQKDDLRKQIHNVDHLKSSANRNRVEELEKQLKEEKCKRIVIRDRLTRAEGQVKISGEQASQLEAALEQARSKTWNLERTVQQLREQNQKLQHEFDKELNKFTESIRENTSHLEEIAEAREKLQTEKEDLEKRLTELSTHYNESLKHVKHEMNINVVKLIEIEKRYEDEKEEKHKLEAKVESLCSQLLESELRHKDMCKQLQEKEAQLCKATEYLRELELTKHELTLANEEMDSYRKRLAEQCDALKEIERNFKQTLTLEQDLRQDISNKDEYISELEKKVTLLEQQLQESESKMTSYEEQLKSLKNHISQLQEDFGDFENLKELHGMINQQRAKLLETTRQNGELAEALQKKDMELERHIETVAEQEHIIEQRDGIIKMLSEKEEEHTNIIKLLRNNLEIRTQADMDLNQQLTDKNAEIESLVTNLETRKQQISQLEKIILTLEDQTRKASAHRRKDQEKIQYLESKIAEYETYHMERKRSIDTPADNLDSIIKILEDELESPVDPRGHHTQAMYFTKKSYAGDHINPNKSERYAHHDRNNISVYEDHHENMPTKIVVDSYSKKPHDEHKSDNLDRKKAITSIDTQKYVSTPGPGLNVYDIPPTVHENFVSRGKIPTRPKDIYLSRNLNFITPIQLREDKKCKMFKFAGHRLS
ncbi:myosin-11-like isoform X1 [Ostrinia furnacalis]|uniref:myosin-11-like isoform X1 n=1 Tax=Ostrinia furnacalis TaxID=93504 RepID=UPI00103EA560|nr:myosin-11-like isoform X1 [Ostrinia furnacalis]